MGDQTIMELIQTDRALLRLPRTLDLFVTIWESLQSRLGPYQQMYTGEEQRQCRTDVGRSTITQAARKVLRAVTTTFRTH